jgi:aminoglycoside phosphotransferase (APT) family kinase protein
MHGEPDDETVPAGVGVQARHLEERLHRAVELYRSGGESRTFAITGTDHIVTVPHGWPDTRISAAEIVRRTTLQARIGARVRLPVPEAVRVLAEDGIAVVHRLPGGPLLDVAPARRHLARRGVAAAVGGMLADLHTWAATGYEDLAETDDSTPTEWMAEAADLARELDHVFDGDQRDDVRRFLAASPPRAAGTSVLSHNDLGIEHILVTADGTPSVTGVIDWDDAAVCDPAYDFGLILRDLGPSALDTALAAYVARGGGADEIVPRSYFYARCKLLEDLAFGMSERRPEFVDKSLRAWPELFGPLR